MKTYHIKVLGRHYEVIDHSFPDALRQLWNTLFTDTDRKRFKSEFTFRKNARFVKAEPY